MQTKNVRKDNFEDSKYCYVILRKGTRPKLSTQITSKTDDLSLNVDDKRGSILTYYHRFRIHFQ